MSFPRFDRLFFLIIDIQSPDYFCIFMSYSSTLTSIRFRTFVSISIYVNTCETLPIYNIINHILKKSNAEI